ncbi:HD domain-containing protein [Streptococcus merionis]|uniref:Putative hydrolase n=1 Tax=Streptococcus merionis TaxID=400065 RepID=A0A239SUA2_9STRE|nr:HD domain-containing protein [Streptococcus merionis]SNU88233.1 putative hydrolase [Streptococcus merionis]
MHCQSEILETTETFVKDMFEKEPSGHDWWHLVRVRDMAVRLAEAEGGDVFICQMAALLHDVADDKLGDGAEAGLAKVQTFLDSQAIATDLQQKILTIISDMSYKAGQNDHKTLSLEGQIVQDADRLDALGAIGIARTMVYSGHTGRLIHDPNLVPREQMTLDAYRSNDGTAIMHFYEKLLKLKDLMNTETAKVIAEGRHAFLETYLEQFYAEWRASR